MSITNDTITIAGNIGTDPLANETRAGKAVINFRVATSSGYFDQRTGAWVEGNTNWYAVSAFGNLAVHAKASLRRGDAVIVAGRLRVKEWEANGKKGVDVEIVADAIGHDLSRGTSAFARRPRSEQPSTAPTAPPADPDYAESDAATDEELDAWGAAGLLPAGPLDVGQSDHEQPKEDELSPA